MSTALVQCFYLLDLLDSGKQNTYSKETAA